MKAESRQQVAAVVIGTSAGALEALSTLLSPLPSTFSVPILCVVHLHPDMKSSIAECLSHKCLIRVCEAEDKEPLAGGTVYLAPPDYHLLVEENRRLSLSNEAPEYFSRPSIDVLFESAADVYGRNLIGVILTGANRDGARGLKAIEDAGGTALVQLPDTAFAREMPQSALDACTHARALTLQQIATYLMEAVLQR
ncbi:MULTISPECIES: chemotaxis protein CheB [unclassified Schlesneria]|uniref:chemotaxis protein CheB n=1 Tax=unclassified Schlesneria TaxID=2762017 RepID=UPI00359F2431